LATLCDVRAVGASEESRMRQTLRIGYWPYEEAANGYGARMRELLGTFGEVTPFSERVRGVRSWLPRRRAYDVVIVNWLENKVVDAQGRPSYTAACKLFVQTLLFRLQARRLIFVRHNRYPHTTQRRHAARVSHWLDVYEQLFDLAVTHSAAETKPRRDYCPHPLYRVSDAPATTLPDAVNLPPGYFVVFGRIEPYKQIEALIERFPNNQRLLVVGATGDADYARRLRAMARDNVVVAPGFLAEPEAQAVVRRSAGVILSHADDDMVVSGSFFYAMSLGRPVIAVETPFIRWVHDLVGEPLIVSAPDLPGLCSKLTAWRAEDDRAERRLSVVREAFGEQTVRKHLARILEAPLPAERGADAQVQPPALDSKLSS
jgi:glycosyltransferase involved in cell wall biosynthesis